MFKKLLNLVLGVIACAQIGVYGQSYCTPTFSQTCAEDAINDFYTTGGVQNITNMGTGCTPSNYIFYSNQQVSGLSGDVISIGVKSNSGAGFTWTMGMRIWVDWNGDGDFDDIDEDVWNSGATTASVLFNGSFKIPVHATPKTTRLRVIGRFSTIPTTTDYCSQSLTYGECEDYVFTIIDPIFVDPRFNIPPVANFAYDVGIDTLWVNTPYIFVNTSSGDSVHYWNITPVTGQRNCFVPGFGCHLSGDDNFKYTFTQTGTYAVKLAVANKMGKDSITKQVVVANPTRKPVANFYFDKDVIGVDQQVQVVDYSQYGATNWEWSVKPARPDTTGMNLFLPASGSPYPLFWGREVGQFDVCLKASNALGTDSICKQQMIQVNSGNRMCRGVSQSKDLNGYLYSNNGPVDSYDPSIMDPNCGFYINSCATSILVTIEKFKLRKIDTISFRDGGPTGPIILKIGGHNPTGVKNFYASSGRLYVQWHVLSNTPINGGDSGFVMLWSGVESNYTLPETRFASLDTTYSGQRVDFKNTTTGQGQLTYSWDINGDGVFGDVTTANGAFNVFTTQVATVKNICLKVANCRGENTFCKPITILPIVQQPDVRFTVNSTKGFSTDEFYFTDQSIHGVTAWNWEFLPNNVAFVQGTDASQPNPVVRFGSVGKYKVTLTCTNPRGQKTLVKDNYIEILSYEGAGSEYPIPEISDIGINRVRISYQSPITNSRVTVLDHQTDLKTPMYDKVYETLSTELYRGVDYRIEVYRGEGSLMPTYGMDRAIWIDKNVNAQLTDQGEEIYREVNSYNLSCSTTFRLPDEIEPLRYTRMRVGVSAGYTALNTGRATVGCFEDYAIQVGLDNVPPSIKLIGSSVYRIEINKPFVDLGVSALDNFEGEIGHRAEVYGNLDTSRLGIYTIKYVVKDLYGNASDTAYRTIQVEINQTGPVISLVGPDTAYVEVGEEYTEQGASAVDNLGNDISARMIVQNKLDLNQLGVQHVFYTITDFMGFTQSKARVVIVRDTKAPHIWTRYGGPAIKHQIGTPYTDYNILYTDNYYNHSELTVTRSGIINSNVEGQYNLKYVVCDPSGNCTEDYYVQVNVKDTIVPQVVLLGNNPMVIDVYEGYEDPGVVATDNYYTNSALVIIKSSNVDGNKLGEYQIEYLVRDGAGNSIKLVRDVFVVDRKAPQIELLGTNPVTMNRFDIYKEAGVKINDNYYEDELLQSYLLISTTLQVWNGDTLWAGAGEKHYVTYQVIDPSGNISNMVTREIYVTEHTGIADVSEQNMIGVYPNPAKNFVNVVLPEGINSNSQLEVYNLLGAKVYQTQLTSGNGLNTHRINTHELPSGVYMIRLTINNKDYTKRLVIE
jgi:PKD repeat protein